MTLCYEPQGPGPHPAIVVGMEATGINHFIRDIAAKLAGLGYVTAVPDYYRGGGPPDPDDYDDIEAIMPHTLALDFPRAARDLNAVADALRARDDVIMSAEQLDDVRDRLARGGVDHEVRVYEGAGHAFSAPSPTYHHAAADAASWTDAVEYLTTRVPPSAP